MSNKTKKTKAQEPIVKEGLFVLINLSNRAGSYFPRDNAPTFLHQTDVAAHIEANRLAALNPGQPFAVFQCVGITEAIVPAPVHRELTKADIELPSPF